MTEPVSIHDAEQTLEATQPKRYAAYSQYKDSAIPWVRDIPDHWQVRSCGSVFAIRLGKMLQPDAGSPVDIEVPYFKAQHVQWENVRNTDLPTMWCSPKELATYDVVEGDLLVCEGGEVGRAGVVIQPPQNSIIQNALHRVRDNGNGALCFLMYVLEHAASQQWFDIICNRATIAHFTHDKFSALRIPFPPPDEQQAIALFLDEQAKKIDDLIEAKRDLLGLIEEKKQSVISHAVIGGLRPKVPLKESTQHWLGDIPEHWNYMPIKWIVQTPVTDGPHETPEWVDEGIPFVSAEGVFDGRVHLDRCRGMITPEQHREYSRKACPKRDDIFIVKSGATTGKVGYVDFDNEFNIWSPLALIRCEQRIVLPRYVYYAFIEVSFQRQVQLFWSYGTQPNIGMGDLQNLVIAIPPLDEQREIINHLEADVGRLNALAVEAATAIESLGELRSGIISAAVTGKIDVRGGAA